jgi:hypothetical protein
MEIRAMARTLSIVAIVALCLCIVSCGSAPEPKKEAPAFGKWLERYGYRPETAVSAELAEKIAFNKEYEKLPAGEAKIIGIITFKDDAEKKLPLGERILWITLAFKQGFTSRLPLDENMTFSCELAEGDYELTDILLAGDFEPKVEDMNVMGEGARFDIVSPPRPKMTFLKGENYLEISLR